VLISHGRSRRAKAVHQPREGKTCLSVRQAAFIGVGAMVGAGIFALLGEVAGMRCGCRF
jgi:hypothetical protein